MSEFTPPLAQPVSKPTPGVVNIAAYLQWFTVLLSLVGVVLTAMYAGDLTDAMVKAYEDQGAAKNVIDGVKFSGTIITVSAIIGLVVALVYALLGFLNRKGKNGSRIATWVLSGIFLLCGAASFGLNAMSGGTQNDINMDKVNDAIADAVPPIFTVWQSISGIVSLVIYVAVIVLLALPAANDFFRKEPPPAVIFDPKV
ncbi:hypothetical protein Afil01_03590 [Actinorhabdospora filicis]|uniref:Uncharacterized protein n=1 Tax=Actinorhabdospora filicis TaxID=1785913 RepID=A0A9W6SGG4_9ACTN|nr:hypothetical protein [Actinorhabdospora filicis]GLZ75552.1 hypothetical protein Afil01_03590 [Actinorhabdospora filicis]